MIGPASFVIFIGERVESLGNVYPFLGRHVENKRLVLEPKADLNPRPTVSILTEI